MKTQFEAGEEVDKLKAKTQSEAEEDGVKGEQPNTLKSVTESWLERLRQHAIIKVTQHN